MKRVSLLILLICSLTLPYSLSGQVVNATVCNILASPQSFNGKIVRIKGVVVAGFEEFTIKGGDCNQAVDAIWLAYPHGTKGKAGPAALLRLQLAKNSPASASAVPRTPVTLDKNTDFEHFDKFLSNPAGVHGICLGCVKYTVAAVLVGRLDAAKNTGLIRDHEGKVIGLGGFGNLNRYRARLVLQSVSDVTPQKIDYTAKGKDVSRNSSLASQPFQPGAPTANQVKQAVNALGAPGEDNGVTVGFDGANEVPMGDGAKSNANSPDGLLFHAIFDTKLLKRPSMQLALTYVGSEIADIRSKSPQLQDLSLYGAEFRAWQTVVLMAAALRDKTVMLPGGYMIYNKSWPNSKLGMNANTGISGFLANWANITNTPGP